MSNLTATTLPIASIVALPALGGIFQKERANPDPYCSNWIFCGPSGARSASDAEVDEELADDATVLRVGGAS